MKGYLRRGVNRIRLTEPSSKYRRLISFSIALFLMSSVEHAGLILIVSKKNSFSMVCPAPLTPRKRKGFDPDAVGEGQAERCTLGKQQGGMVRPLSNMPQVIRAVINSIHGRHISEECLTNKEKSPSVGSHNRARLKLKWLVIYLPELYRYC